VTGDDEVLTAVGYRSQPINVEIGNHIGLDELPLRRKLRE
jgi:hypothetical protein